MRNQWVSADVIFLEVVAWSNLPWLWGNFVVAWSLPRRSRRLGVPTDRRKVREASRQFTALEPRQDVRVQGAAHLGLGNDGRWKRANDTSASAVITVL